MDKLGFQDAAFLRLENAQRPFHVGGLLIFSLPPDAPRNYLRSLVARMGTALPDADPIFLRRLDPGQPSSPHWIPALDFEPGAHLHHYALPGPGRQDDLMQLVSRAHERLLDRGRPLWEWHVIEGLPGGRFAMYCKVHHALIDGMGALRLLMRLLDPTPRTGKLTLRAAPASSHAHAGTGLRNWIAELGHGAEALLEQGRALPELAGMLARMGRNSGEGKPPLPFTAPHALMNRTISARRQIITLDLPLATLRRIGAHAGGTLNDALLAICGGALRSYLREQGALPRATLLAGVPVSVKADGAQEGNSLSTLVCPFETHSRDPLRRLRNITRVTQRAKQDLRGLSKTAREDYMNLVLLPTMVLTLAHAATAVPPAFNVIVSNVPGPSGPLYLAGSRLEAMYPLSVVTDAQAMNITAVSCGKRLCIAVTTCPDDLPGIADIDGHLREAYRELAALTRT